MCLTFWQCCVISESFYAYHWQCYVSNRNGALFVAIGKLMEIGIGGFLLPRTKVLRKWQIHSKQLLHHLRFCRSVRQVVLPRCGKLQLQVPQNSPEKKLIALFSLDRSPGQTSPRRTTSWRTWLEAAQTLVRWGRCCTPSSSPSSRCL